MTYLGHVQAAVVAYASDHRPLGEVHARVCKKLGQSDPVGVRLALCSLVSGKIGRDGRSLRPRRRQARLQPGAPR